ncbi:TIGR00341 family protein [Thiohalophilus sp.]|uniref:TIGR00341 family protein n=1 Tax=Thiohalophilus sp. TaxID=3028392 RepID=UPI003976F4C5
MRIIEVVTDCGHVDTLISIAEQHEVYDHWHFQPGEETGRCICRMLVTPDKIQDVIDALQSALGKTENSRIIIQPVEATLPRPPEPEDAKSKALIRSREELYTRVAAGSTLDNTFIMMAVLSTVVVAIGLLEDNVAVVIGAMVIAPLLGPNMAMAFAAALGDTRLALQSLKTNVSGVLIALLITIVIGLLWPLNFDSQELLLRTDVGLEGIVLALASGMAAGLSLTSGISATLVGVMVAVALLPPAATLGLMLGAGNFQMALGALLLLAVNVVCVNLAAKITFLIRGVRPRTWWLKQKARQSMITYIVFWIVSLIILLITIPVHERYLAESVQILVK